MEAKASARPGGGADSAKSSMVEPADRAKNVYRKHLASEGVRGATRGADDKRESTIAQIEQSMMQLNIDRDKKKMELEKIPDNAKTIA